MLGYLTYFALPNRNTKWVFDEAELKRFCVQEKLAMKNIVVDGSSQLGPFAMIEKLKNLKAK